ncbi:TfoX/Sxy family protein [Algisphaera agarilytica]|uniref:TfoX N-terminal domain-containing protein n=1 Tax=Algisphaera agarilytica TaxID=1385975 RepID=A0A7X0H6C7_9BACT|nr:TfoX/Sxy family protein [Algisphaera agarilytica]MBB6430107.1 hypothetical protein [Algisphaera agarilytica]
MPSDPAVSKRVRSAIADRGFEERFFFGGDAWFFQGNFAIGIYHDQLTCRIGVDAANTAIDDGLARPMDITGKPMKGWVFVDPPDFDTKAKLVDWIDQTADFVSTLPAKAPKAKTKK